MARQCSLLLAGLAVAAISGGSKARADDAAESERLFREATAAMDRNEPRPAAVLYRRAWSLEPRAKVALDLGVALAEIGSVAAAAEAFEVYLADPASDPAKRPVVEQQLGEWRPKLGRIALHVSPPDAVITIDDALPLHPGGEVNVPASAGLHHVAIRRVGFSSRELTVTVSAQSTSETRTQLVALAPSLAPVAPVAAVAVLDDRSLRSWTWIALGAATAAGLVGTYFGVVAVQRWNVVRAHCPGDVCASSSDLGLADHARTAGYAADVAFVAGGVALAGALLLWRMDRRGTTISLAPTRTGAVVGWQLAF